MNLRDLQLWLNAHGASIVVDGVPGPRTRGAILELFRNFNAPAATPADITLVAAQLGGSPRQVAAVAAVESSGRPWDDAGRLKCLYERHYFWKRVQIKIPLLSDPTPGGYTIDADKDGINDSWEKVAEAAMRSPLAAFESASWGKFQIMGAWATKLGYTNAIEFVWELNKNEANHYYALRKFIEVNGLKKAFQAISTNPETCRAFARGYNGGGYAKYGYHTKIAEAMR